MKNRLFVLVFVFGGLFSASSQEHYERSHRIRKSQFPSAGLEIIHRELNDVKRLKFYKEIDSSETSFEAKFKRGRLLYGVEFNENGVLKDIEVLVKQVDIPSDAFVKMVDYLKAQFSKYRIKKIQQQYPAEQKQLEKTFRNAFQNLLIPSLNYKFLVSGKKDKKNSTYNILFDADGNLKQIRKSLPPNYDHVLY